MTETGDDQEVLKYFYRHFTSNIVKIGSDNVIKVEKNKSRSGYGVTLQDLLAFDGIGLEITDTRFLETYTRDDLGVSLYVSKFKATLNGDVLVKGTAMGMATAKIDALDEKWKIGNYNMINVRQEESFEKVFSGK